MRGEKGRRRGDRKRIKIREEEAREREGEIEVREPKSRYKHTPATIAQSAHGDGRTRSKASRFKVPSCEQSVRSLATQQSCKVAGKGMQRREADGHHCLRQWGEARLRRQTKTSYTSFRSQNTSHELAFIKREGATPLSSAGAPYHVARTYCSANSSRMNPSRESVVAVVVAVMVAVVVAVAVTVSHFLMLVARWNSWLVGWCVCVCVCVCARARVAIASLPSHTLGQAITPLAQTLIGYRMISS
jgi:hypothetical protein